MHFSANIICIIKHIQNQIYIDVLILPSYIPVYPFEPPLGAGMVRWRPHYVLAACVHCSDLGIGPFRKASARADVTGAAPGSPCGSSGVLMWVIKSFAIIHLEQQPCLTWDTMTAPQIEREPGRHLVGYVPRAWGRHVQLTLTV